MEYRVAHQTFTVGITIDPEDLQVLTLQPDEGDAVSLSCRLTPVSGHAYLVEINGTRYRAHAVQGSKGWHVNIAGQQILVEPPEILEQERRRGTQVDTEKHVTPPMPGQVIKILVAAGDSVEAGQPVIVISAMKMETSLAAPHNGMVAAIHTQVGAQVMPGDILVDIDEAS